MKSVQDQVFHTGEGDAWYRRNESALCDASTPDPAISLIAQLSARERAGIGSVCDIGCANGWRLARLRGVLENGRRLAGFDASSQAIAAGRRAWPDLDLHCALADAPPFTDSFDLVIVSFVLHWVDRSRLLRVITAIDELVAPNGLLMIADFLPDRPCARRYHHREDVEIYTYKQDYVATFAALGLYREVAMLTFSHEKSGFQVGSATDQDRAVCALLRKPLDAYPRI